MDIWYILAGSFQIPPGNRYREANKETKTCSQNQMKTKCPTVQASRYSEREKSSAWRKAGCSGLAERWASQRRGHPWGPLRGENSDHCLQRGVGILGKGTDRHKGAGVRQRETCVGNFTPPRLSPEGVY